MLEKIQEACAKFDRCLLENILKNTFTLTEITDVNIEVNNDSNRKGDSYLSVICRFTVDANGKDATGKIKKVFLQVITKIIPKNIARRKTFRSLDFFSNEVIFFNTVWPALKDFQKRKNVEVFNSIPICYYALSDGINDFIALEDVSFKGFQAISRGAGLDLVHSVMILKLFARFHGVSLAFKNQAPEKFAEVANSLRETYLSEKLRGWYENFQKILIANIRDSIEKQLSKEYLNKFNEITSGDFYGKGIKQCEKKGKFAVVTHGDAWAPNFLVKYGNNGAPLEAIAIDFQLSRYSSLAQDILFFLYTCTTQELRNQYWDVLIEEYYKDISETVRILGSADIITLNDIKNELKENGLFGLTMCMEAVTMSLLEDDETADIDSLQGEEAIPLEKVWIIHPFESAEKRQRIADIFKDMVDRGYLQ